MEIRLLSAEDLDDYFALRLEMLQRAPNAFLVTHDEQRKEGPTRFAGILERKEAGNSLFGAFLNGQIAGCVGVRRSDERLKTAHKATIWGMYVAPHARRKGVGEALIAAVIGHARGPMGVTALFLSVEAENREARALYERTGFRVWGTEPRAMKIDGKLVEEHHLWLPLD